MMAHDALARLGCQDDPGTRSCLRYRRDDPLDFERREFPASRESFSGTEHSKGDLWFLRMGRAADGRIFMVAHTLRRSTDRRSLRTTGAERRDDVVQLLRQLGGAADVPEPVDRAEQRGERRLGSSLLGCSGSECPRLGRAGRLSCVRERRGGNSSRCGRRRAGRCAGPGKRCTADAGSGMRTRQTAGILVVASHNDPMAPIGSTRTARTAGTSGPASVITTRSATTRTWPCRRAAPAASESR